MEVRTIRVCGDEWMKVKLKDLGKISTGNTPSKKIPEFYDSKDIGFVKPDIISEFQIDYIENTTEYLAEAARNKARIVKKNAVFVTCIGSIGKIGIVKNKELAFNQQINAIEPNEKVLPKYLAYGIFANKRRLQTISNAPVVPIINKTQFGEFEIDIINDTKVQLKVVELLDKVSELIANRKEELIKLDELIQARFVEMFGEPGADDFGWGLVSLGSVCCINPKKSQDKNLDIGEEVSFVPMTAVTEHGEISTTTTMKYDDVKTGFTYFAENDVLFAKITPCMENGKGAVARGLHNRIGFGSTEFHVLRPISGKTNSYWIYMLTAFPEFRKNAASNMTGSAGQRRVPVSFLENYQVAVPPIELQEQFAAFVEQTDKSKSAIKKSLEKTQLLFDSLMQKYFG